MKTKRRITVMVTSLAVALVLLVGLTMAYLTDSRSVLNQLGIGVGKDENGNIKQAVQISLEEPSFIASLELDGDNPVDSATYLLSDPSEEVTEALKSNLVPGDKIFKDPTITNVGSDSVYLRVKIDVTADQMEKMTTDLGLAINDEIFTKGNDNYWYYTGEKAGASCAEFSPEGVASFFKTTVDADSGRDTELSQYSMLIPNTWKNSDVREFLEVEEGESGNLLLEMKITAQAIQFKNFEPNGLEWTEIEESDIEEVALGDRRPAAAEVGP